MKGEDLFSSTKVYYGEYTKVNGLFRSNPVVINGHTVGHVTSVEMDKKSKHLFVGVILPDDYQIPKNSILKITNKDLVGSKAIEIMLGQDSVGFAASGDTLGSMIDAGIEQAVTDVMTPLTQKVGDVLENIDTAISDVSLQTTLNDLSATLKSFQATTVKLNVILEGNTAKIGQIVDNINDVSKELKTSSPKFTEIISGLEKTANELSAVNLKDLSVELTGTIKELKTTLQVLQGEEGTIGKLARKDDVYVELMAVVTSLDSLAKDIITYPRRYTGITDGQRKKGDRQKEVNEGIKLPTSEKK